MQKAIRKGVPPLFVDLRPLYSDPDKAAAIQQVCNEFLANLRSPAGCFEADGNCLLTELSLLQLFFKNLIC